MRIVEHKSKFIFSFLYLMTGLFSVFVPVNADEKSQATILYFEQSEPGIEPYQVRYVVTERFLRIDEAGSKDGFILFDKNRKTIYSVSRNNKSILEIAPATIPVPESISEREKELVVVEKKREDVKLPMIGTSRVDAFELGTNDETCIEYSIAEKLMPGVLPVLSAYETVLSDNNRINLINQPKEYLNDCMLINDLFAAGKYLQRGFPVMLAKRQGVRRLLVNFQENEVVDVSLFDLPESYRRFRSGPAAAQ